MILTIRTDKPEAEIGLYDSKGQVAYETWQAHRELSDTILINITNLLANQQRKLPDLTGIVVFKGPGSFTGLRIGMSVANTLAYGLSIPVVAETGEQWVAKGLKRLQTGDNDQPALPEYGGEPNITKPRK